jgi:sucrose phosphorylase
MHVPQVGAMRKLLSDLYQSDCSGDSSDLSSQLLHSSLQQSGNSDNPDEALLWDGSDSVLITYADTVTESDRPGLWSLRNLVNRHLEPFASVIHVLPFLRSTSDGGFAVASYDHLEERHGDWSDLASLGKGRRLMADLVLNHVSASHPWVQQFLRREEPGQSCVLEAAPDPCWDNVVRPRSTALFTQLGGAEAGKRQVWTTFGPDQVDLNWRSPEVLIGFADLLQQMCRHGVRWIRLDAVGFVWKEPNTTCIHRPEAYSLVKVLRLLLESMCPDGVVVTETNVPEQENLSYLRIGQGAHLAYNFPLPPLLLEATISGRADLLNLWLSRWPDLPQRTGLLNFSACHDGVGLRPLEGLMPEKRLLQLLIACEQRGGLISHRRLSNGDDAPYEINISWWSAMADGGIDPSYHQLQRFLLTQLLVMMLPGVPAFYLPALLASPNDVSTFRRTGQRRDLNRPRFRAEALNRRLDDPDSDATRVLEVLRKAMAIRASLKPLHPDAGMRVLSEGRSDLVVLERFSGSESVFGVHNMTSTRLNLPLAALGISPEQQTWFDHLQQRPLSPDRLQLQLEPYAVAWLSLS